MSLHVFSAEEIMKSMNKLRADQGCSGTPVSEFLTKPGN
jgi:hypothetical protein